MVILDACAFIWLGLQRNKLSPTAIAAIETSRLAIASITFLEIGYLIRKKRISVSCSGSDFTNLVVEANDIEVIPLTPEIVELALSFPKEVNNDPADRIISATTIIRDANLITSDSNLLSFDDVPTIW